MFESPTKLPVAVILTHNLVTPDPKNPVMDHPFINQVTIFLFPWNPETSVGTKHNLNSRFGIIGFLTGIDSR